MPSREARYMKQWLIEKINVALYIMASSLSRRYGAMAEYVTSLEEEALASYVTAVKLSSTL